MSLRSCLCIRAAQIGRGRTAMIGRRGATTKRLRMTEVTNHVDVVAERLQGLEDFGELEAGTVLCRSPLIHRCTVREVDGAEARSSTSRGLCLRCGCWNHRFQEGQ